ncbi:MAG: hypothetical protein ACLS9G_09665, partial [Akkermansia sp.]
PRFHNGGISSAAAAQHAKLHHGRKYNLPPRAGQDRINAFFPAFMQEKNDFLQYRVDISSALKCIESTT